MKIRSIDIPRPITFRDGRTLTAPPEGIEVPADLEAEARQIVDLHVHIEEVREPKKTTPEPTGSPSATGGPDKSAKP